MRDLTELLVTADPAFPLIQQWAAAAAIPVEILPPLEKRERVLLQLQVTTRSVMGAIAYETGGILVDGGWLRLLGSGSPRLPRDMASWNEGKADGFLLVGDDILGGFFALNGGAFGGDHGTVYYLSPDQLEWESLGAGFSEFVEWSFTPALREFYGRSIIGALAGDVADLSGDQCLHFYPYLWTQEGSVETSARKPVSIHEQWDVNVAFRQRLAS